MARKEERVYLLECIIETECKQALEKHFLTERKPDLLSLRQFEKIISGPFKDREDAFHSIGNDYRFNLGGPSVYALCQNYLKIPNKMLGGPHMWVDHQSCREIPTKKYGKREYYLLYHPSKRIEPLTNLKAIIEKYYPYGPDY